MSANNHSSLSLRAHLQGLSSSIATCDPNDHRALTELQRQLIGFRAQLERDHVLDQLTPAALACQIVEHLLKDGNVTAKQGLAMIDTVIDRACDRLDVERTTDTESEAVPSPSLKRSGLQMLSSRKLGEIMVQLAVLDAKQVERALAYQNSRGCRLGEALIELGLVSKDAVQNALKVQRTRTDPGSGRPWRNTA